MDTSMFPQAPGSEKVKSYWNRPGGKAGTILGILGLGTAAYYLFPILTNIVWNVVNLGIACAVGFALFMLLSNKKLWMGLFYLYEILIKKFIGIVIELDPFIIAENYINGIRKSREVLYAKCEEVDAQKEALVAKIAEKESEKKKQLRIAEVAQQKGMGGEVGIAMRQVERLDIYIKQLVPIKVNLEKVGDYLTKVHKNSKYMLDDMVNDLELKKDLYKSVTKGNNALKAAMSVFNGNAEEKLLMEQSMEFVKDDIAVKLASMKKAIDYSGDFMRSIDLENASFEMKGLELLEQYNPELFSSDKSSAKHIDNVKATMPTANLSSDTYKNLID